MAIGVTQVSQFYDQGGAGQFLRYARLDITGLSASGANTVPHGLKNVFGNPQAPPQVSIEPTSSNNFYETQAADSTNIYITTTGSGAGTTCSVYVTY